jgi:hypothetical protein
MTLQTANLLRYRAIYRNLHRYQQRCQILQSQLGFDRAVASRPSACVGCDRYHGIAYGQTRATRTLLVCAFHPYGWLDSSPCPDWQGEG